MKKLLFPVVLVTAILCGCTRQPASENDITPIVQQPVITETIPTPAVVKEEENVVAVDFGMLSDSYIGSLVKIRGYLSSDGSMMLNPEPLSPVSDESIALDVKESNFNRRAVVVTGRLEKPENYFIMDAKIDRDRDSEWNTFLDKTGDYLGTSLLDECDRLNAYCEQLCTWFFVSFSGENGAVAITPENAKDYLENYRVDYDTMAELLACESFLEGERNEAYRDYILYGATIAKMSDRQFENDAFEYSEEYGLYMFDGLEEFGKMYTELMHKYRHLLNTFTIRTEELLFDGNAEMS